MEEDKKILVFYIDVRMLETEDIPKFMENLSKRIVPENINAEGIMIPVYGETKVECINPVYIKDEELIKKHERLMSELHEHINNQLNNE
jgi:hypothetical protein